MKTNKKGISLIVLAITIIVMIILASAIILSLSGKNMIGSAKEATTMNDLANAKHVVAVAKGEWQLGEVDDKYTTLGEYAKDKLQEAGFKVSGTGGLNVSEDGVVTTIFEDASGIAYIPEGYVASEAKGENTIAGGLVIYEGYDEVTDRNVKTAQTTRNQFVWVPVSNMSEFKIDTSTGNTSYNMNDATEALEYKEMRDSVANYGGFYMARYESGKEGTGTVVTKKNATVWGSIKWADAKAQAATLSRETSVVHIIYGEEWDTAVNFIAETYPDFKTTATGFGNHTGNILTSGASEEYAQNNIYDMTGNVWDWTMESLSDGAQRAVRGGTASDVKVAAYRFQGDVTKPYSPYGFRMAMYLK